MHGPAGRGGGGLRWMLGVENWVMGVGLWLTLIFLNLELVQK